MHSHLTRGVIRRLLLNDGFRFNCVSRPSAINRARHGFYIDRIPQRRTIRDWFPRSRGRGRRGISETDVIPGLDKMQELERMEDRRARPPPVEEVADAFMTFFSHKEQSQEVVTDAQARTVVRSLKYLLSDPESSQLSLQDLVLARDLMQRARLGNPKAHAEFAREIYKELSRRRAKSTPDHRDLEQYIYALASTGHAVEGRDLLRTYVQSNTLASKGRGRRSVERQMWLAVMKGLAAEDNEPELVQTARLAEESGLLYNPSFHEIMTTYYARKNDVAATRSWFERPLASESSETPELTWKPTATCLAEFLRFCIRNKELDWCSQVFKDCLKTNPSKAEWDVIFQWAVEVLHKGVEDLEHMMETMKRRNMDNPEIRVDSTTINNLVELAMSKGDLYLAERYTSLGLKLGVQPDAKTHLLQLNYRIDANDMSGAYVAYEALRRQAMDITDTCPTMNRYLRALCNAKSRNIKRIREVQANIDDSGGLIDAETVVALCKLNLELDEPDAAMFAVLNHTYHHTLEEKRRARDLLLEWCVDPETNSDLVWGGYKVIQISFGEVADSKTRSKIMTSFFDRGKPKIAFDIFKHMLELPNPEQRPGSEEYVQCIKGIIKCKDGVHLDTIRSIAKMDQSLEPDTKFNNAMMLAELTCGSPGRAEGYWLEISSSIEGPNYTSLVIAFKVYELDGLQPAAGVWRQLRKMEIDIPPEVTRAYVCTLTANGAVEHAKDFILGMKKELGYGPDAEMFARAWNSTRYFHDRDRLQKMWAEAFPVIWAEMEGIEYEGEGREKTFNVDMSIHL